MSDELDLVLETAGRILDGPGDPWPRFVESGLHLLAVPEPAGGGWLRAALAVTALCGERAAGGSYGDLAVVAYPVLAAHGVEPVGVVAVAPDGLRGNRIEARRVTGGQDAERVLAAGGGTAVLVERSALTVRTGENLAGEPRDDLAGPAGNVLGDCAEELMARGALARAAAMAGAARAALRLTVAHTTGREQFGRPLARFQAVQQSIAGMAGDVEAMRAAVDAAAETCARDGFRTAAAAAAVATAKIQTGLGAAAVARVAHQLHGAIGTTREHALHRSTLRLASWRDEYGTERHWSGVLGAAALAGDPWDLITRH